MAACWLPVAMSNNANPIVISYGGGTNSTALLWGMYEKGIQPDLVLFADTGGEMPGTYLHVGQVREWALGLGWDFRIVSNADPFPRKRHNHKSLEDECHNNQTLPSLAFGFKGCSAKWKRQPMDRAVKGWDVAKATWAAGGKVERWIGIDADEAHRSAKLEDSDDPLFIYRRPLIDWDWGRDECVEAISRSPFTQPGKSACFFCPAAKKREVFALAREYPELFARAVAMEEHAKERLGTTKGLGRSFSWKQLVEEGDSPLYREVIEQDCGCYEGGDTDDG